MISNRIHLVDVGNRRWWARRWLMAGLFTGAMVVTLPGQSVSLTRDQVIAGITAGNASRIRVSQSGAMALADVAASQVRVVAADGRRVTMLSAGTGSRDFGQVNWYGWVGASDSLWVADLTRRRILIYAPDLTVARTFPVPAGLQGSLPWSTDRQPPIIRAVLGSGHLVLEAKRALPTAVADMHRSFPVLTKEDGEVLAQIPRLDVPAPLRCEREGMWGSQRIVWLELFCNAALVPIVSDVDGQMITIPDGEDGATATRVVRVGTRGDTLFDRAVPIARKPLLASEVDSAAKAQLLDPPPSSPPALNRLVDSLRRANAPAWWPSVQRLMAGLDGTTWLRLLDREGAEEWLVLDGSGAVLFPVRLPVGARLMVASRQMVWVFESAPSSVDGMAVVRYRLSEMK